MARRRLIDPKFWIDSKLGKLSLITRLVFISTWSYADDEGYYQEDYEEMKATLFPYNPHFDIRKHIKNLIDSSFIEVYSCSNTRFHHIKNFKKFQKISHPTSSEIKPILENSGKLQKVPKNSPQAKQSKVKLSKVNLKKHITKVSASVPIGEKEINRQKSAILIDPLTEKRKNNAFKELTNIGVNENIIIEIFKKYPLERIEKQIEWLPYRKNDRNKAGLLVKAIEKNYMIPLVYERKIEEERKRR